jgi:hypothetical protein
MCIRSFGTAAKVLGQEDLAERAARLLCAAPDEAFWAGLLTNIELPAKVPEQMRTIEPTPDWEARYQPYSVEETVRRIRKCSETEEHFALCLKGRGQEARALAKSGLLLEEVGDTLAILGRFEEAQEIACDPALEPFRQWGVRVVLVIEFFRRGRMQEAQKLLNELESHGLGFDQRVQLALGFSDRVPWGGYPYQDW